MTLLRWPKQDPSYLSTITPPYWHLSLSLFPYQSLFLFSPSLSLSTVHKICLGVISPPTQENNERQWHDRLDIDEIAAVTICTSRLGPSFASEIEKGWRACVCVRVCMCESVGAEDGGGGKG